MSRADMSSLLIFYLVLCVFLSPIHTRSVGERNKKGNQIEELYPVDTCIKPPPKHKVHYKKLKGYLREFLIQIENVKYSAEQEMDILMGQWSCDIREDSYKHCGLKHLNPQRSKREYRKLGIPTGRSARKGKQLLETAWWMTSMMKASLELKNRGRLNNSLLINDLEDSLYYLHHILVDMKINVPPKSSVCYRKETLVFAFKKGDYGKDCEYAYLAIRDIVRGLEEIKNKLGNCRISVKKGRKNNKTKKRRKMEVKLRCKGTKSVFYKKCRRKNKTEKCNGKMVRKIC